MAALSAFLQAAPASAAGDTATLFTMKCAACHTGGGNIVQPGASLFSGDLERNGVLGPDAVQRVYDIIYAGKNKMYGFGELCAPKGKCTFGPRLPDGDIRALAQYTLDQAAKDWKP